MAKVANENDRLESGALKETVGKSMLELIPPRVLLLEGDVFTYGAKKYGEDNWREGISQQKYIGAALRHLVAYGMGENNDKESGLPHLSHARACIAMMQESQLAGLGDDDRKFITRIDVEAMVDPQ